MIEINMVTPKIKNYMKPLRVKFASTQHYYTVSMNNSD